MDRPSTPRVILIGAGIGGLSAGIALRRAGIDVRILERAASLKEIQIGYGLHVWPNATRALRDLGVLEAVEASGARIDRMEHVAPTGRAIITHPAAEESERIGTPTLGIMRADLHGIMSAALGEGIIRFGARVTGFSQDADGVTVTIEGGGEERGDVLVAADGVRSFVRDELLSEHGAVHGGLIEWHAPVDAPELVPAGTFREVWGRGARFGFYPIKQGTCWYILQRGSRDTPPDTDGAKTAALERAEQFPSPSRALVEATPAAAVYRLDIWLREPAKRWSHGRVTLLGDAAHAMTPNLGQGAAQSIEDAIVLAKCLRERPDVPDALREYQRRRLEHVNDIAQQARRLAKLARWRNPVLCASRNRIAVPIWQASGKRQFAAMHEHAF
jgi:2-polyprenyl-6-methoxyphenol hydroxylase-like FAD-dependent oxidoreductase